MRSRPPASRPWLTVAGLLAAAALAAKGVQEIGAGTGWILLVVAAALLAAIVLRRFYYRG
jgi:hypothetical protein